MALFIFLLTLTLVIVQPKGLGIGWSACAGALLALVSGVVSIEDVVTVWGVVWDATFTFVALIVISLLLDRIGFFSWAALHIVQWGRGRTSYLFVLIILLGAVISAVFANDGAAPLLTPIVISLLQRLQFSTKASLVFIIATGFIADTASLPLVISNLVNLVSANYFSIAFTDYARVMVPVNVASILATIAVLWVAFGRALPKYYQADGLESPISAIRDHRVFACTFPLLGVLLGTYFITASFDVPISLLTGIMALCFLAVTARLGSKQKAVVSVRSVLRQAPWHIVVFSVGMYVVVYGLANAGLTHYAAGVLRWFAQQGDVVATLGTGFAAALLSSIMNNLPATLVGLLAIEELNAGGATHQLMVYANIIGNDLGPKLTPIGSLATLLWLYVLAGKGFAISWQQYMRIGVCITPPVLLFTLLALVYWLPMVQ